MLNDKNAGIILFLVGTVLLVTVGLMLYFGIPLHAAKSEIEGWGSYNSVARSILGTVVCMWAIFLSIAAMIGGVETWLQRGVLPSWLTTWQTPAPTLLREEVISLVARALGVAVNEVDEDTKIVNLYAVTPHVARLTGKMVYGKKGMTVGDLLKQI